MLNRGFRNHSPWLRKNVRVDAFETGRLTFIYALRRKLNGGDGEYVARLVAPFFQCLRTS